MPLTPEESAFIVRLIQSGQFFVFSELYATTRGILSVVAERLALQPEHLETDVKAWVVRHRERLLAEARDRWREILPLSDLPGGPPGGPSDRPSPGE
ncbi:MAG: hypothetical protein HY727_15085 [Candidatus Rokubacteria bacterium]|nr:hypothetical protein [Candidatus Rokubacteria bacterium]